MSLDVVNGVVCLRTSQRLAVPGRVDFNISSRSDFGISKVFCAGSLEFKNSGFGSL
jgi:hypothetical protein